MNVSTERYNWKDTNGLRKLFTILATTESTFTGDNWKDSTKHNLAAYLVFGYLKDSDLNEGKSPTNYVNFLRDLVNKVIKAKPKQAAEWLSNNEKIFGQLTLVADCAVDTGIITVSQHSTAILRIQNSNN